MKPEDKQLLFVDLSARLPYGVKCFHPYGIGELDSIDVEYYGIDVTFKTSDDNYYSIEQCKPYLRPMSSMTEDEKRYIHNKFGATNHGSIETYSFESFEGGHSEVYMVDMTGFIDWLNRNMFDYRGLIPKGLAIEASEDIYKI